MVIGIAIGFLHFPQIFEGERETLLSITYVGDKER